MKILTSVWYGLLLMALPFSLGCERATKQDPTAERVARRESSYAALESKYGAARWSTERDEQLVKTFAIQTQWELAKSWSRPIVFEGRVDNLYQDGSAHKFIVINVNELNIRDRLTLVLAIEDDLVTRFLADPDLNFYNRVLVVARDLDSRLIEKMDESVVVAHGKGLVVQLDRDHAASFKVNP